MLSHDNAVMNKLI